MFKHVLLHHSFYLFSVYTIYTYIKKKEIRHINVFVVKRQRLFITIGLIYIFHFKQKKIINMVSFIRANNTKF